jgi:hypothetical protein
MIQHHSIAILLVAAACGTGSSQHPPDAVSPDAAPPNACDPNPCIEPHKTTCTASAAGAACSCDSGFVDGPAGACVRPSDAPTYDQVRQWVLAYKAAHPGNGGKDWDINAKTDAQLAADPDAQRLVKVCGDPHIQRPVFPLIAWEYGGADHPWISPDASPLAICVYIPVSPSSSHWKFASNHVVADTWVLFPDHNPCGSKTGAAQVADCIGDPSNFEILVDTASLRDGADVGLSLAEASTDLNLIPPDGGAPVHLYSGT